MTQQLIDKLNNIKEADKNIVIYVGVGTIFSKSKEYHNDEINQEFPLYLRELYDKQEIDLHIFLIDPEYEKYKINGFDGFNIHEVADNYYENNKNNLHIYVSPISIEIDNIFFRELQNKANENKWLSFVNFFNGEMITETYRTLPNEYIQETEYSIFGFFTNNSEPCGGDLNKQKYNYIFPKHNYVVSKNKNVLSVLNFYKWRENYHDVFLDSLSIVNESKVSIFMHINNSPLYYYQLMSFMKSMKEMIKVMHFRFKFLSDSIINNKFDKESWIYLDNKKYFENIIENNDFESAKCMSEMLLSELYIELYKYTYPSYEKSTTSIIDECMKQYQSTNFTIDTILPYLNIYDHMYKVIESLNIGERNNNGFFYTY